ncbi:MAG: hypothetical protein KAH99_00550 [Verrucomicrobia bacterium]|nr:hypothetical protein [Verrucomicrobiota bacterium]
MTAREKLQYSYELAFYPPRLNAAWQRIKNGEEMEGIRELLDTALLLHQALPESGFASQRALQRLALYQAKSRAFGMVAFLKNIRSTLGCPELEQHVVPGNLVRDIGLPPFSR